MMNFKGAVCTHVGKTGTAIAFKIEKSGIPPLGYRLPVRMPSPGICLLRGAAIVSDVVHSKFCVC